MIRVKSRLALLVVLASLLAAGGLGAHDLFLRLDRYLLRPDAPATAVLLNGTFDESENAVARDRMTDVSVLGPDASEVTRPPASAWRDSAGAAVLRFRTRGPGTYLLGVSTRTRTFTLSGDDFDAYLRHDGLVDVLAERREAGLLGTPATETYSKHVKAVVQVGTRRNDTYRSRLGYPVELVPLANPYRLSVGDTLPVRFLKDGEPVEGQIVYARWEGHRPSAAAGAGGAAAGGCDLHPDAREPICRRTDADGVVRIPLARPGRWYARLIHMREVPEDPEVDYESNWATLTWAVSG